MRNLMRGIIAERRAFLLPALGVLVLVASAVWLGQRALRNAEQRGRDNALTRIARVADSTASARVVQAHVLWQAQQKTDTVWRTHVVTVSQAGAAIAAIPPAVRDSIPPVVEAALDACEALVADTAALHRAILTERTEARRLFALDTAAIDGLKAQVVQRDLRIGQLERRPSWGKVVLGGLLTAAVAFVAGGVAR